MDPNQSAPSSANTGATPEAPQAHDIQQPVTQYQEPNQTSSAGATTEQNSEQPQTPKSIGDGKSWTEYAGLQKIVNQLPQGVRDFCANPAEQFNKLSTTQKVAGAVALAGLGYLAFNSNKGKKASSRYDKSSYKSPKSATAGQRPWGSAQRTTQSYRAGSFPARPSGNTPDAGRRLDQGPGWWNSGQSGPDATYQQSGSASTASSSQLGRGSDVDFGSGV
ncbi:hypothetical protein [Hymenobacter pini]|uniref:hypothetical protein n=1 Tax=Hymenobacter pini TaxID=2880879 RepID=UPI001CF5E456|nr:hypothetical protein [Hymenobacter pini]